MLRLTFGTLRSRFQTFTRNMTETITHQSPLCDGIPPFAVIVLNQPIPHKDTIFKHIWKTASIRLCADGGTNRLHDTFAGTEDLHHYIPDYITGDFDSLRPEVKEFYEKKGVIIQKNEDQDSTDFTKCVNIIREKEKERSGILVIRNLYLYLCYRQLVTSSLNSSSMTLLEWVLLEAVLIKQCPAFKCFMY
ncbi:thiamine pyrophosphokinase, variant 2 [Basidiobolus ranarum]|uniref:Thiamine pyrophosphokinase, variant 2 n=1 Tax=Basidiobolus ranarum TaxID=34480 RepID=A0ABR2VZ59_9FUNG